MYDKYTSCLERQGGSAIFDVCSGKILIERYAFIAGLFGVEENKHTKEQMAEMSGDVLREHITLLNLSTTLSELDVKRESICDVAKSVLKTTKRAIENATKWILGTATSWRYIATHYNLRMYLCIYISIYL